MTKLQQEAADTMSDMITTLNDIRRHGPCAEGWEKLLKHLGKAVADDEPLSYLTILESNGLDDTCWAMRCRPDLSSLWRHFGVDCAERVKHLMKDERSLNALAVARGHACGWCSDEGLRAARDAARDAARAAARAAAWAAARAAARDAAWDAARDAARAVAWAAARAAARDAAWDAERCWQTDRLRKLLTDGKWTPVESEVRDDQV